MKRPVGVGVDGAPIATGIVRTTREPRSSWSVRADRYARSDRFERHMRGRSWRTSSQPIWLFRSEVATTPSHGPRWVTAQTTVGEPQDVTAFRWAMTRPCGRVRRVRPRLGAIAARAPVPDGIATTAARGSGLALVVVTGRRVACVACRCSDAHPIRVTGSRRGTTRATLIANEYTGHARPDHPGNRPLHRRGAFAQAAEARDEARIARAWGRSADLARGAARPVDPEGSGR